MYDRPVAQGSYLIGALSLEPGRQLLDGTRIVKLGRKALDLLTALAAADGRLLTKDDLMAAVWPGLTIEENAIHVHVSALRKALGPEAWRLATVHGLGYRLDRDQAPPGYGPVPGIGNLPAASQRILGRADEIAELGQLLSHNRLLTLTGCGGIGKTSLAIELGRRSQPGYPGGAWLARLDQLADGSRLVDHLLASLGSPVSGPLPPADQLMRMLARDPTLLIVDNAEHLLDAVAMLAVQLLEGVPELTLLVTSRQPLDIPGELVWRTPGLRQPGQGDPVESVIDAPATALFMAHMAAARAGPEPDGDDVAAAAAICRRLDGVPLAIQLAAARYSHLTLRELHDALDQRLDLLARGHRTAPPRQQTMAAALDWSHGLLPPEAQILLRRLSVFAGGWTREAAAWIAGHEMPAQEVDELLATLVAASLVEHEGTPAGSRYRLLEVVRSYARQKLGEAQEMAIFARSHARYFRDLAAKAHSSYETTPGPDWRVRHASEIDNFRAAWAWASSAGGDARLAGELAAYCMYIMLEEGLLAENRQWLYAAGENLAPDWPPDVAAIIHAGRTFSFVPGVRAMRDGAQAGVAHARAAGDPRLLARCLNSLAIGWFHDDPEQAETLLTAAIDLVAPTGLAKVLGISFLLRSEIRQMRGDALAAEGDRSRAIEVHLATQDYMPLALALGDRIEARLHAGDLDTALALAEEAVRVMRSVRQANRMPRASFLLGTCLLATGAVEMARDAARDALSEGERATDEPPLYAAFVLIAMIAVRSGADEAGARLLGHVAAWRGVRGIRQKGAETSLEAGVRAALDARYSALELDVLLSIGAQVDREEASRWAWQIVGKEQDGQRL